MIGYDGVETEIPVQKVVNVDDELTGNSGNLCRMWTAVEERAQYYMERVNVYDAIYRVDADQVTTYVNSYGIDWAEEDIFDVGSEAMERVLFSQAGTYLQFSAMVLWSFPIGDGRTRPMVSFMPMTLVRNMTEQLPLPFSMGIVSMCWKVSPTIRKKMIC